MGHKCPGDTEKRPIKCSNGTFQTSPGQSSCLSCQKGRRCPSSLFEEECPIGTFQNKTEQTSCEECPKGQSCVDKTISPINCPIGTFSPLGISHCLNCSSGKLNKSYYEN